MADLPTSIHLTVVTQERKVLEADVEEVELPGSDGYLGVLPGHTPLLAMLKIGVLSYRQSGRDQAMAIKWGFAEVLPDRVIVLAQGATPAEEIDPAKAEALRQEALRELALLTSSDSSFASVEAKLQESLAMLQVSSRGH